MYSKISFSNQKELYNYLKENKDAFFLGEFLRELDKDYDELIVILEKNFKRLILTAQIQNQEELLNISDIFYGAYIYQNEIYDFYGKMTKNFENNILRLHLYSKKFFPYRKLGKPMIKEKNEFKFSKIEGPGLVEVPVGPIHAGIIPPGHFRFIVDGEDVLNLEIQLGWKTRLIDKYFLKEFDLTKLLEASQEIVGDSAVSYTIGFAKNIENSSDIKPSGVSMATRVVMLELERIYNHLWTIGALANDVGQSYVLNGFLSIREEILNLNEEIFGSRLLKGNIQIGNNKIEITQESIEKITKLLYKLSSRIKNLINIVELSSGMYDRFKDTGIITLTTVQKHNALGLSAKASGFAIDSRLNDEYYNFLGINDLDIIIGKTGDSFDRFMVRAKEIFQSIEIINKIHDQMDRLSSTYDKKEIKLNDGYFVSNIEGHRGENLQIMIVQNKNIVYYKHKDPSFVNWTLLEYAVLKNIIADFPICNKSLDLSYSGFDM